MPRPSRRKIFQTPVIPKQETIDFPLSSMKRSSHFLCRGPEAAGNLNLKKHQILGGTFSKGPANLRVANQRRKGRPPQELLPIRSWGVIPLPPEISILAIL
jgi:hypothetical protein